MTTTVTVYPLVAAGQPDPPRTRVKLSEVMGHRRRPADPDPDVEPGDDGPVAFVPLGTPPAPPGPDAIVVYTPPAGTGGPAFPL